MKKILLALLLGAFLLSSCGTKDSGNSLPVETNQPSENTSTTERMEEPEQMEDSEQTEEPKQMENTEQTEEDSSQQDLSEKLAMEISYAEEREKKIEKKQEEAVTQLEMNETAEEMYRMWDDTLNAVWGLLKANLNEADMEVLRKEEREWIASKEAEVQAAGQENEGGSLQPLLEAMKAAELTKARVYELAEYVK